MPQRMETRSRNVFSYPVVKGEGCGKQQNDKYTIVDLSIEMVLFKSMLHLRTKR